MQRFRAFRVALIYLLFSILWIGISDQALYTLVHDPSRLTYFQSIKGWVFVIISGLFVLFLVQAEFKKQRQWELQLLDQSGSMQTLIENIPGIVYRAKATTKRPLEYISPNGAERLAIETHNGIPVSGVSLMDFIHERDIGRVMRQLESSINTRSSYQLSYQLATGGSAPLHVLDIGQIRRNQHTGEYILEGVLSDISPLENAQQELFSKVVELGSLRTIDQAILSAKNLDEVMAIILEQIRVSLGPKAIKIVLADQDANSHSPYLHDPNNLFKHGQLSAKDSNTFRVQSLEDTGSDQPTSLVSISLKGRETHLGRLEVIIERHKAQKNDWKSHFETLAGQLSIALEHVKVIDELKTTNRELISAQSSLLTGWARALEHKDRETQGHSDRVTQLMRHFGESMGMRWHEIQNMIRGALLHDIGKMAIPDSILNKPGPLTSDEWQVMKQHPLYAEAFLKDVNFLEGAMDIPLYHHERWDGQGYPFGLHGKDIPLAARMFAIVDRWDALTHDRPYRKAWSKQKTIEHLQSIAGQEIDPELTERFFEILNQTGELKSIPISSLTQAHATGQD